jgi:hypothetical protein
MPPDPPQPASDREPPAGEKVLAGADQPEAVRFADQLRIAQFGIIHMLLWMTATAVLLKVLLAILPSAFVATVHAESPILAVQISQIIVAVMTASGLMGAAALLRARCWTMFARLEPGHWIVLIFTSESLLRLIALLACRASSQAAVWNIWAWLVTTACSTSFLSATLGYAIFRLHDALRWKVVLSVSALGNALTLAAAITAIVLEANNSSSTTYIANLALWGAYLVPLLLVPLLIFAAILDRRHRVSRDWVHWLGVVLLGLGSLHGFAWSVLTIVALRMIGP